MNSLLIAGFGYVGRVIAEQHIAAGGSAIGLARSEKPDAPCPVHTCDLSSAGEVASIAEAIGEPAAIIHCAASGRGGGADAYRAVYLEGVRNLIAAFPGVPLVFTSSTGVYPQDDGSVVTEESPAEPERETARILREAEDLVLENGGTVLRLSGIYGPGRSIHLERVLSGQMLEITAGTDGRTLNQIHRDDAASAARHLAFLGDAARGQIFNGTDSEPMNQRHCHTALCELIGFPVLEAEVSPDIAAENAGKRGLTDKVVSNAKLLATGWCPRYENYFVAVNDDPILVETIRDRVRGRMD